MSVVFLVRSPGIIYVAKMASTPESVEREVVFYKEWSKQDVKTPEVLKLHTADKKVPVSIVSLEYINSPILSQQYDVEKRVKTGVSREMGRTLARMHKAKGKGFGVPTSRDRTKGSFATFKEEYQGAFLRRKADWLIAQTVLTNKDILGIKTAINIIEKDVLAGMRPALTHNDFRPYNIFASKPMTVFDPNPRISHPYICLALSLVGSDVETDPFSKNERDEILLGYSEITAINNRVLSAAIILGGMKKAYTWQKKREEDKVNRLMALLRKHQDIIL
jgi:fructosamine-3-kinase